MTARTPRRIQHRRTAGWRKPQGCVIVSRPSRFGNPFTLALAEELGYDHPRQAVIGAFTEWLGGSRDMWQSDEGDQRRERILTDLHLLRGQDLACTCPEGESCHGDLLLEWANLPAEELGARIAHARERVARNRAWRGEDPLPAAGPDPAKGTAS